MKLTTALAAVAAAAGTVSAKPIQARACSVAYPQSIGFPIQYAMTGTRNDSVSFQIPATAQGCQLSLIWPQGYSQIQVSGSADTIDIYDSTNKLVVAGVPVKSDTTHLAIDTFTCATIMSYSMVYSAAKTQPAGFVKFNETLGAGIVMEYDCAVSA